MGKNQQQPTAFAQVFADNWLDKNDTLHFDFDGLAKTLAELAWNPNNGTPFNVVIRGGWGRGKTTLMRRAETLLQDNQQSPHDARQVETLWFNAWKYQNEETVLAGLLGVLVARFQKGGLKSQLKGFIQNSKSHLVKNMLVALSPGFSAEDLKELKISSDPLSSDYRKLLNEKRAYYDVFREVFPQLAHLLLFSSDLLRDKKNITEKKLWESSTGAFPTENKVIAIFLDDLDRCREEKVLEVLEAINLFLDLPGVVFYIGLDWERLTGILHKHFEPRTDEFLEKIVQMSLELPEVNQQDAGEYVAGLIAENAVLGEVLKGKSHDLAGILARNHPRHIKRFLNDLSMRLAVLRNTGRLEGGDKEVTLTTESIIAWHVMHEALSPAFANDVAKLSANVRGFFRKLAAAKEQDAEEEKPKSESKDILKILANPLLDNFANQVDQLDPHQMEALVHLGTLPEDALEHLEKEAAVKRDEQLSGNQYMPDWVTIPAGGFQMGGEGKDNEKPVHEVIISNEFRISKTPVTNKQYLAYVNASGVAPPEHWKGGHVSKGKDEHPVVNVSWDDAMTYCRWLRDKYKISAELQLRLPTEAEWEYVAGGTGDGVRKYPWGDSSPDDDRANYGRNTGDTSAVGSYPKGETPEGVQDMAGNVWEWCSDFYHADFYKESPEENPLNLKKSNARVLRGGSFDSTAGYLRCAYRDRDDPDLRNTSLGFRLVVSPFSCSDL